MCSLPRSVRRKAWNKTAYYTLKWTLLGALVYAIFLNGIVMTHKPESNARPPDRIAAAP